MDINKLDKNLAVNTDINEPDVVFHDVRQEPFEVYGLYDYKNDDVFKRMPEEESYKVSMPVHNLSLASAGGRVRFCTDSEYIAIDARIYGRKLMAKDIMVLSLELHEAILNDDLYKSVKQFEEEMMNDRDVILLISNYQKLQDEYNDCLRYNLDLKNVTKALSEAKIKLYENELVARYQETYKKLNEELGEIKDLIFKDVIFDLEK